MLTYFLFQAVALSMFFFSQSYVIQEEFSRISSHSLVRWNPLEIDIETKLLSINFLHVGNIMIIWRLFWKKKHPDDIRKIGFENAYEKLIGRLFLCLVCHLDRENKTILLGRTYTMVLKISVKFYVPTTYY